MFWYVFYLQDSYQPADTNEVSVIFSSENLSCSYCIYFSLLWQYAEAKAATKIEASKLIQYNCVNLVLLT